jgi:membrane protein YqaA with SNARE-associated domain
MTTLTLLFSLFAASVVSSLVPVVNAEALVLGAVLAAPPALTLAIVVMATAGQVLGKVILYQGGMGLAASKRAEKSPRARELTERLAGRPGMLRLALFASATTGLPPLYVMAVVSGATRLPLGIFALLCTSGRVIRFYALALVPALF